MFSRALGPLSPRGFVNAAVTWTLILAFAFASTVARAAGSDRTFGALSITSDPPGATVYVDGAAVGQTPLTVDQLPAGDHRVKIVKTGYLENGRVVTVASGQSKNLNVKLTAGTSSGSSSTAIAPGGSTKKWLIIGGVAVAGAAAVYLLTKSKNEAPNAGTPTASPSTALQGALVSFNAAGASDPDGDSLTYSWAFGDGGTGTGASVTHAYTSTGNFTATLTVSDGKKSATSSTSVTIRSLSATWRGPLVGGSGTFNTTVVLSQNGATLSGTYVDQFPGTGIVTGTVGTNGSITFSVAIPGFQPFTFTGTADGPINVLTGVANGSGFVNRSWTMTRG